MLKSLRSDILHEAESEDLKVIIISGISLKPVVSGPERPCKVSQNVPVSWDSLPHFTGELLWPPLKNIENVYATAVLALVSHGDCSKGLCSVKAWLLLVIKIRQSWAEEMAQFAELLA